MSHLKNKQSMYWIILSLQIICNWKIKLQLAPVTIVTSVKLWRPLSWSPQKQEVMNDWRIVQSRLGMCCNSTRCVNRSHSFGRAKYCLCVCVRVCILQFIWNISTLNIIIVFSLHSSDGPCLCSQSTMCYTHTHSLVLFFSCLTHTQSI